MQNKQLYRQSTPNIMQWNIYVFILFVGIATAELLHVKDCDFPHENVPEGFVFETHYADEVLNATLVLPFALTNHTEIYYEIEMTKGGNTTTDKPAPDELAFCLYYAAGKQLFPKLIQGILDNVDKSSQESFDKECHVPPGTYKLINFHPADHLDMERVNNDVAVLLHLDLMHDSKTIACKELKFKIYKTNQE